MPKKKIKLLVDFLGQKAGTIIEVEDADATQLIELKKAEAFVETKDGKSDDTVEKAADDLIVKFSEKLNGAIATVVKNAAVDIAKTKRPDGSVKLAISGGTARNDDEEKWGYKNLGDFAIEVKAYNGSPGNVPEKLKGYIQKAPTGMSESVGEDGGILVPTTLSQTIYERVFDQQDLLGKTDNYTLPGNSIVFPGLSDASRADGSRWGGIRGYWLGEAAQKTASKPKFTRIELRLHKAAILIYVTDELREDSAITLDQWLGRKAGDELAFITSNAIYRGDGVNKPLGVLNSPSLVTVSSRTLTGHISFADITRMYNRMWAPFRAGAAWYVNQAVEPDLMQLTFAVKNVAGTENVGGWPLYVPPGGLSSSPYATLLGKPVIPVEYASDLGTVGDILFWNPQTYVTATKSSGVQAAMSIHLRFDYDETAFRFVYRVDGQPWWNLPVTPLNGSNTYGPAVALAT